jgi:hypothetical protein
MGLAELAALVGLGAFHGLNPGMGWLFAVAIGLQERSKVALLRSIGPIAAGHLASMAVVAVAVMIGVSATTSRAVAIAGGAVLVAVGMLRLLSRRHFRWVGMRLTAVQLATWSFLMASVHGAGLMLVPVLTATAPTDGLGHAGHAEHTGHAGLAGQVNAAVAHGAAAAAVHTLAMVAIAAAIALCVYQFLGLRVLRTAWVNLDRVWAAALVGAGSATVIAALA